jgi:hypothetical protein
VCTASTPCPCFFFHHLLFSCLCQVDHARDTGVAVTATEALARRVCQHLLGCGPVAPTGGLTASSPHVEAVLGAVTLLRDRAAGSGGDGGDQGPWLEVSTGWGLMSSFFTGGLPLLVASCLVCGPPHATVRVSSRLHVSILGPLFLSINTDRRRLQHHRQCGWYPAYR